MTADEAHDDLQAALAEEDEHRTESIRTMALVVIALELRDIRGLMADPVAAPDGRYTPEQREAIIAGRRPR